MVVAPSQATGSGRAVNEVRNRYLAEIGIPVYALRTAEASAADAAPIVVERTAVTPGPVPAENVWSDLAARVRALLIQ